MIDPEMYLLKKLKGAYEKAFRDLEMGPLVVRLKDEQRFIDADFTPTPEEEKLRQRAAQAKTLYDNFRAMVDGPNSHFWYTQVPHGQRLYLQGKAKPSVSLRALLRKATPEWVRPDITPQELSDILGIPLKDFPPGLIGATFTG